MSIHQIGHKVSFADMKTKLPQESWMYTQNEAHNGEFEAEEVWLHSGDLHISELLLDEGPFLILVEGNLTVDRYIGNTSSDAASSNLVVLGNLITPYMIVGGQEIYITGNLYVEDMFWGDYNHGELTVRGNVEGGLLVSTDQYTIQVQGQRNVKRQLEEWEDLGPWRGFDMLALFVPECVIDEDTEPFPWREEMLKRLQQGQPVINRKYIHADESEPDVPDWFEDHRITAENIERLTHPSLLPVREEDELLNSYEFWLDEQFCRVSVYGDEHTEGYFRSLYFQDDHNCALLLKMEPSDQGSNSPDKHIVQPGEPVWMISGAYRYLNNEKSEWNVFSENSPADIQQLSEQGWSTLLQSVSNYQYARSLISHQLIHDLLALPVVEPYDDYYDDDRHGLWIGELYYAFRQAGQMSDGFPQPAMLRIGREYVDAQGETQVEKYYYTLHQHADGSESVLIEYSAQKDEDEEEEPLLLELHYIGGSQLLHAVQLLEHGRKVLIQANEDLLNGELPYAAETFAKRFWKSKGYLK
ncbi:hypothetical protein MKX33_13360 [Paenibacillus sp. FSL R5-0490]|uniref:hypothetical protein n=1 Tax=Paenibacillus sp. FSL R5-0490 TaxID=1920424 RepID=UPI0030D001C5